MHLQIEKIWPRFSTFSLRSFLPRRLLAARGKSRHGIRPSLHPGGLCCDSATYSRYAPSPRLVRRALDRSRCSWDFHHGLLALALLVLSGLVPSTLQAASPKTPRKGPYELRGRIVLPDGGSFRGNSPLVILEAVQFPLRRTVQAGWDGRFRIKKLPQSAYKMAILVPGRGEMKRTVDIGPTFADKKGRIEATFVFEPTLLAEPMATVTATRLSVDSKAVKAYRKALKKLEKGESAEAIKELEKAVEIDSRYAEAWNRLGTIAYVSRDFPRAEYCFGQALKHAPESYPPVVNLGAALLELNQTKKALAMNLRAVRMREKDPLAHAQLGSSYYRLGRHGKAIKHLKLAKQLAPRHHSGPQLILADIYWYRKEYAATARELAEFLHYHPDWPDSDRLNAILRRARALAAKPVKSNGDGRQDAEAGGPTP